MEAVCSGIATVELDDPPSMMHGASWESLHITPLSVIEPVQQPSCVKGNRRGVRSSVRLIFGGERYQCAAV